MAAWLDSASKCLDRIGDILLAVANVMLALLFVLINVEIVLRTLFSSSTLISDEYSGYLLCAMTLVGLLHGVRNDTFLKVTFLVNRTKGGMRQFVNAFAAAGGLSISAIATYASAVLVHTTWLFNTVSSQFSETPLYLPQSVLPLGFGLLTLAYAVELLSALTGRSGHHPENSVA
jgi:TRAP-type C4-dicarboxylate transport system permease small subunit